MISLRGRLQRLVSLAEKAAANDNRPRCELIIHDGDTDEVLNRYNTRTGEDLRHTSLPDFVAVAPGSGAHLKLDEHHSATYNDDDSDQLVVILLPAKKPLLK